MYYNTKLFIWILLNPMYVKYWASQMALLVKNPSANAWDIRYAGSVPEWGRSLEESMATHSSILAWRIPWLQSTWLSDFHFHFSMKWFLCNTENWYCSKINLKIPLLLLKTLNLLNTSIYPLSQPLVSILLLSVSVDLTALSASYERNHVILVLLWLAHNK